MALQELDINSYSCPGYVEKFRKAGVHALMGFLSTKNLCCVALASALPIRPMIFPDISQPDTIRRRCH